MLQALWLAETWDARKTWVAEVTPRGLRFLPWLRCYRRSTSTGKNGVRRLYLLQECRVYKVQDGKHRYRWPSADAAPAERSRFEMLEID